VAAASRTRDGVVNHLGGKHKGRHYTHHWQGVGRGTLFGFYDRYGNECCGGNSSHDSLGGREKVIRHVHKAFSFLVGF
jgi:hypothetical protein